MRVLKMMNQSNPNSETVAQTSVHFAPHKIGANSGRLYQGALTDHRTPPAYGVRGESVRLAPAQLGHFVRVINDRQQLTAQAIQSFNATAAREASS